MGGSAQSFSLKSFGALQVLGFWKSPKVNSNIPDMLKITGMQPACSPVENA